MMRKTTLTMAVAAGMIAIAGQTFAHCEIPCGIYDDEARLGLLLEHVGTIEKSMTQITELSAAPVKNSNQLIRWVSNKEAHANEIQEIVTQYFMTQRIKVPADGDEAADAAYQAKLTLLHKMLVHAMKAKQTTDRAHTDALRALVHDFGHAYLEKHIGGEADDASIK